MKLYTSITAFLYASLASAFAPDALVVGNRNAVATRIASAAAAAAANEDFYIDDERRLVMNLLMVGAGGLTVVGFGLPFILFFVPPGAGGGPGSPVTAKDLIGNDIRAKDYLASKPANDRSLAQGLKGDATYLIVKEDKTLEKYGLNAVCTHLGCVVPWVATSNKFVCNCHGSQYSADGTVVRGPAPLPLALAHCDVAKDDKILLTPWLEDDFRTGGKGWWI